MWIPKVSVFTPKLIEGLRPEMIHAGIKKRLALLTYLFCPDEEEEPELVLRRLRIEAVRENELKIRWRERMRYPTRLYRFGAELARQIAGVNFGLQSLSKSKRRRPEQILHSAIDGAGFLQSYDRGNMGWPVVIAAAAALVEQAGGVIVTNGSGWFIPSGNEVKRILDP
jgi:hypothetical protein